MNTRDAIRFHVGMMTLFLFMVTLPACRGGGGEDGAATKTTSAAVTDDEQKAEVAQPAAEAQEGKSTDPVELKAQEAVGKALDWLKTQQEENGSYGNHPGVTAMALLAFSRSHRRYTDESGEFISGASKYLVSLVKPDGSIYDQNLPNYNTSLSIMALDGVGREKYREVIQNGQKFLAWLQVGERQDVSEDDSAFGGIGYAGSDGRPDLANLHFALEALATTGYDGDKDVYRNALIFLQRCQNRSESNDQPWAADDGGFVYRPGESKAGGTLSYGSMTYAGLKSLMYAQVDRDDPRVQDAWKWIRNNWDLESNVGMGNTGIFYYYHTFSQALAVWGEPSVEDAKGNEIHWFKELSEKVISLQHPDGYWLNENTRYWEGNKILSTARAVLSLAYGLDRSVVLPPQK